MTLRSSDSSPDAAPGKSLVQVRGLTKTYREGEQERAVLSSLDLILAQGTFVVLMGRSGSGKSTLLNCLSGIDLPTRGEVIVGGKNLTALSEKERTLFRRRHIGFIFQSFNLIPTLTVAENITLPLELSGGADATAKEHALGVLERIGLTGRADSFPDRLSGGEQQRVAVARALAHDPLLILADEPTGNLDYDTGQQVLGLLSGLLSETGKTLLVATHDPALLDRADRVLELQGGRLSERRSVGVWEDGEMGGRES